MTKIYSDPLRRGIYAYVSGSYDDAVICMAHLHDFRAEDYWQMYLNPDEAEKLIEALSKAIVECRKRLGETPED